MVEAEHKHKKTHKGRWIKVAIALLLFGLTFNSILYFQLTFMLSLLPIMHYMGSPAIPGPFFYGFVFPSSSWAFQWDLVNGLWLLFFNEKFVIPVLAVLSSISLIQLWRKLSPGGRKRYNLSESQIIYVLLKEK